jgi:hypothetical protein
MTALPLVIIFYFLITATINFTFIKARLYRCVYKLEMGNESVKDKLFHKVVKTNYEIYYCSDGDIYNKNSESGYNIIIYKNELVRNRINYLIPFVTFIGKKIKVTEVYEYKLSIKEFNSILESETNLKVLLDKIYSDYFTSVNNRLENTLKQLLEYLKVKKLNNN